MQTQHDYSQGMGTTLISFIIPVHNEPADTLRLCIDSVMSLSLQSNERQIIVVDDGSDTPYADKLTDYQNDIVYIRKPNGGLSSARNTGIQMATGEYIQFVDSDDQLIVTPYEHVLGLIRKSHADLVMFDFTNNPTDKTEYHDSTLMSGAELMRNHNIHGSACGLVFKRNMLGSLRFTHGIYHEDEEFTPQLLLRAETVITTDAEAYLYRKHPNSITTNKTTSAKLKRLEDAKGVILRLNFLTDTLPTEERVALQRRTTQLTMDYIYNIMVETQDRDYLDKQLDELRRNGLFPLPDHDYTTKYKWFRRMTSTKIGRAILLKALPKLKRER